jgi:methylase of polypeptide subunit release factors
LCTSFKFECSYRDKKVVHDLCGFRVVAVTKEVKNVSAFLRSGDEPTTYNLCRMNMIMHDVHYKRFDIKNEDTLERPLHLDMRFEAIVANPPFRLIGLPVLCL